MRRLALITACFLSLPSAALAADLMSFWDSPRHGSNCFNESPPDEAYFRALRGVGATWVRVAFSKWKSTTGGRDFLFGSLDDYRGSDDSPIPLTAKPSDLSCLIYTSGTTGLSKGCMIPYASLYNVGIQTLEAIPVESQDILWTCLPLFHMSAISSVTQAALQMQVRLSICPQFSASGFWEEIERSGAAHALLMGSIFPLVASPTAVSDGSRCPPRPWCSSWCPPWA